MPASSTQFSDRLARIHTRAKKGENTGYVTPGVVDETGRPIGEAQAQAAHARRGSYLVSALGGMFAFFTIVAVSGTLLMASTGSASFEDVATAMRLSVN